MDDAARALANLRIEVSALSQQVSYASLPQALASVRRVVIVAAVMVSASLLVSSVIHAWSAREVRDIRWRVERLEGAAAPR